MPELNKEFLIEGLLLSKDNCFPQYCTLTSTFKCLLNSEGKKLPLHVHKIKPLSAK
jgi:hypothetical protein